MRPGLVATLVENHRRFLAYLTPRAGSADAAEEILQAAFLKSVEKSVSLRSDENAVAWFYRVLRNSLADHYRRRATENRALERHAFEVSPADERDLERTACVCVTELALTLKPEYAEALKIVDIDDVSVSDYARRAGLTANNASVRLHRARNALARRVQEVCGTCCRHGCVDCSCAGSA